MAITKIKIFSASRKWRLVNSKYFSPAENGDWQKQNIFRRRRAANGKRKSEIAKIKKFFTKIKSEIGKSNMFFTENKSEIGK